MKALTDEVLESLRARIGTPISVSHPQPYVTVATTDAIRHWCFGIGDYNPLFLDQEYSRTGPYGGRIAPPSFLYACDKRVTGGVMGLPGVTGMFAGVNWEWRRPVVEGGYIVVTSATVHDVIDREGEFAGRQFQVVAKIERVPPMVKSWRRPIRTASGSSEGRRPVGRSTPPTRRLITRKTTSTPCGRSPKTSGAGGALRLTSSRSAWATPSAR